MAKKDFAKLGANLMEVARTQPSMRPPAAALSVVPPAPAPEPAPEPPPAVAAKPKARPAPVAKDDPKMQQAFELRASLRKQLHRLAHDADMTAGAFILAALRDKGLDVLDSDLIDRRKQRA